MQTKLKVVGLDSGEELRMAMMGFSCCSRNYIYNCILYLYPSVIITFAYYG